MRVLVASFVLLAACATGGVGIDVDIVRGGSGSSAVLVPVTIDGEDLSFLLDTGAGNSALDEDAAARLGLRATSQRQVTGIEGTVQADVVTVDDWSLGGVALEGTDLAVLDLFEGLDGLLGSDVLDTFDEVTIDYAAERLRLTR